MTMKMTEIILSSGKTGGVVFVSEKRGRYCIVVDEDATLEEVADTIKWGREALKDATVEWYPLPDDI